MEELLVRFIYLLRRAGVRVSISETLDAAHAATLALQAAPFSREAFPGGIPGSDSGLEVLREALAAAALKEQHGRMAFDALFDYVFYGAELTELAELDPETALSAAVEAGDMGALERLALRLARAFFARYGLNGPGQNPGNGQGGGQGQGQGQSGFPSGRWMALREFREGMERAVPISRLLQLWEEAIRRRWGDSPPLQAQLALERARRLARQFQDKLHHAGVMETRRDDAEMVERVAREFNLVELPFARANYAQIHDMQRLVPALARKLAQRLSVRRRHGQKKLNFRRTIRKSLGSGGVPIDPVMQQPKKNKPELVLLCDVSSSVMEFSGFALALAYCLRREFASIRSYAFVDTPDEISRFFERLPLDRALQSVAREARVVTGDGHSDYGNTFRLFKEKVMPNLKSGSTLLVLGDARNNFRAHQAEALAAVAKQMKRVIWLNPEPASYWSSGDSVMVRYLPFVNLAYPCANLQDLADVIERLA